MLDFPLQPITLKRQRRGRNDGRGRRRGMDSTVEVEAGKPERLWRFSELAALPAVSVVELGDLMRLEVRAPGATPSNTEVRWDEASTRLLVGVWCRGKPPPNIPMRFPRPELAWFRSFYLPNCRRQQAEARVTRGTITIELPQLAQTQSVETRTEPVSTQPLGQPGQPGQYPVQAMRSRFVRSSWASWAPDLLVRWWRLTGGIAVGAPWLNQPPIYPPY
jgi:hypothetical protein